MKKSPSRPSKQRTATYATNLIERSRKHFGLDTSWNTSMPYPSWPFTQVRGSELEKLNRMGKRKQITDAEEAPF